MESIAKFLIEKNIHSKTMVFTDESECTYLLSDLIEEYAKMESEKYRNFLIKLHDGVLADHFHYGAMKEIWDFIDKK